MKTPVVFFVLGYILFTMQAEFNMSIWVRGYAVWDKTVLVLFIWLSYRLSKKKYGSELLPVLWLALARLVWELVSWGTGLSINNPKVVGVLFIIFSIYVLFKTIRDVRE